MVALSTIRDLSLLSILGRLSHLKTASIERILGFHHLTFLVVENLAQN